MSKSDKIFLVRRTCTHKLVNVEKQESHPLENYRDLPAYVLLGDPGEGKTESFKREAEESDGKYIRARDFATFEPDTEYQVGTLFIDGLDEMRADGNDGRTPLDHIRKHLEKLGRPRFRLSCRESDWLGASDSEALKYVSSDGAITTLHLDPLNNIDITEILKHKFGVSNPKEFIQQAQEHGLTELLRNPQMLSLMVEAVGGRAWPQSRTEIYEMACNKLACEKNLEHRQAKRGQTIPTESLLNAAGYMCAIQLLSGIAGYSMDEASSDVQHYCWKDLDEHNLPLLAALKTNLFQSDGEELLIPVHRSVAEFLGARYLAAHIERHGLPLGRVLALMTGEDGGIVADLRGLSAWLSVYCRSGRHALIERDPVGVVLYGDVRNFPAQNKLRVIEVWRHEAQRYTWFASERWSSSSSNAAIGALCTSDMETTFREILTSPSREEAEQALLDSVLDAISHGERMPSLADILEDIVRDSGYWPTIRKSAFVALLHVVPDDHSRLLQLVQNIQAGLVIDVGDDLLGMLLSTLYPVTISASEIFTYLNPEKSEHHVGDYSMFWNYGLLKTTERNDLPLLLDKLAGIRPALKHILDDYRTNRMTGELLACGLEEHGDDISDERLYLWLGVGLDEYDHPRLDREYANRISAWFASRPVRYKAVIEHGASLCASHENLWYCMNCCVMLLYASTAPSDIVGWYLEKAAAEPHAELSQFYFVQSIHLLKQQGGQKELSFLALEFLEAWANVFPKFQAWLEPFITCPIGDWQQEHALKSLKWKAERKKHKSELICSYRQHIAAIHDGSAYPKIFHELAQAHEGLLNEAHGETPHERLVNFLAGDDELIAAAYSGLRQVLNRADLPSISEIIDLELKGKMHYIRSACLVGIEELFQEHPKEALLLPDEVLSRLLVFRLSYSVGNDPQWFTALVQTRPALVADAILAYAMPMLRSKKEHVSRLYQLAYDDAYIEVSRLTLPKLLTGFPLRAKVNQLAYILDLLLKGALHYLDLKFLTALVARKLKLGSMDRSQRVYWLSCGLLLEPEVYEITLFQYIGKSEVLKSYLVNFFHTGLGRRNFPNWVSIPVSALARLVELLGPSCSNQRLNGVVTAAIQMSDMVRSYINTLGGNPDEAATRELERLISLPELLHWRNELRGALHDQRIARRKATFRHLSIENVSRTLANLQPASAADLAALTFDHLRDIAGKIRDGSTDDYKQFWSYGDNNKKLEKPKPENDCRNVLLSDLQVRLAPLDIDAQREGSYADDKRADIRVSFGGTNGFNVPIEIKKDTHDDLWRSIHEQLIPRYMRDPGTDRHGIYLVFWFGGKGMKPPSNGKKLYSATELEERLRETLTPEENHRIQICVIDCALPSEIQ
ncbi:MAG: hypothetical protein P4L77_05480 [Sulfuriferula sp.]|nr:hypothetical protein [Sulfuriferula sp.]